MLPIWSGANLIITAVDILLTPETEVFVGNQKIEVIDTTGVSKLQHVIRIGNPLDITIKAINFE